MDGWLLRLRQRVRGGDDASAARLKRRKAFAAVIDRRLPLLKLALLFAGYAWMLALPHPNLSRGTYFDENALQPAQVTTYWNWADVHNADRYLEQLEWLRDNNSTSEQRAHFLMTEFKKLGLASAQQRYHFSSPSLDLAGVNTYAVISSPRASGAEAMIISASWQSRMGEGDGTLNLRGVSTVLALGKFLKQYSFWARDIILIVSDGYMDGMQAWLNEYHGSSQTNLVAERLEIPSGVIWTALHIDYPGHSFSHLGIFHEGLNGRLPNQDLINSFQTISRSAGVPVILYDHLDPRDYPGQFEILPQWIPSVIRNDGDVRTYSYHAKNVLRHIRYQGLGRGSGVHGLFHQYRIDAFTMFALPATGPHGFHAIGRVIESTLRTCNNLLERLHASFFFYILIGPARFLKIGNFLPSAVLISVAMMFGGLKIWVDAGWIQEETQADDKSTKTVWVTRKRPVLNVLILMLSTHIAGVLLFLTIKSRWCNSLLAKTVIFAILYAVPFVIPRSRQDERQTSSRSQLLKSLNLCLASTVISATTVLNFSLAACLSVLLGIPLLISSPSRNPVFRVPTYSAYIFWGLGWLLFSHKQTQQAIAEWELLRVWFAPFVCMVYSPLLLQSALVCLLSV